MGHFWLSNGMDDDTQRQFSASTAATASSLFSDLDGYKFFFSSESIIDSTAKCGFWFAHNRCR